MPFKKYLSKDVKKACDLAHAFETKLIRGFSFYHPRGTDPKEHLGIAESEGWIALPQAASLPTCHNERRFRQWPRSA